MAVRALFAAAVAATTIACADDAVPTAPDDIGQLARGAAELPDWATLRAALVKARNEANGGFGLDMWATIVDRTGKVLLVAFSGEEPGDQWPGSRAISAQKANAANAFSLRGLALSTANLYTAAQPGGTLFGLQHSNPVDPKVAYKGPASQWGTVHDPLVGERMGGVNVFGGGLALYDSKGALIGGLGLSGDSSCADHNIAWKVRDYLGLDFVPSGVSPTEDDNIIYDFDPVTETSPSGWGHPTCSAAATTIGTALPMTHPIGDGAP
jgi:uncharacterized protein GlcG (DUF336 family)